MEKEPAHEELGRKVLRQFMDLFVVPEVKKRQRTGSLPKTFTLRATQIVFFPDDRRPQVRIDSEVKGLVFNLKPGSQKRAGEPVFEHEVQGLEKVNLTEGDDPDCGHATIVFVRGKCMMAYDFRYNRVLSRQHVEAAKQFLEAAEFSLERRNWSAFIDNLYSAAELSVKSILLSFPDPALRKKAKHKAIQAKCNRFAYLGNARPLHSKTLNTLSGLRPRARYLKGPIRVSESEARDLLDAVGQIIRDAEGYTGPR